jgi:hypothetical protein
MLQRVGSLEAEKLKHLRWRRPSLLKRNFLSPARGVWTGVRGGFVD